MNLFKKKRKLTLLIIPGIFLSILVVGIAVITVPHIFNRFQCNVQNGRWQIDPGPVGGPILRGYCYFPPHDEGKPCYQDSECEIHCISNGPIDSDGYIKGTCGEYNASYCIPHIPSKTKNYRDLKTETCI